MTSEILVMKHITLLIAVALLSVLSSTGAAHHSNAAAYRLEAIQVIEGTVVMVAFKQPHTYVHVEALDRDGTMHRWSLQWADAVELARHGVNRSTLRSGDHVQVTGHPGRNSGAYQMLATHIVRTTDGWSWGDPREE
jgi:thiamine monophosphate kinase